MNEHAQKRHFTLEGRIGNRSGATVTIEPVRDMWVFHVRPRGLRRQYTMRLDEVADMVCWRVAKLEAAK